jgi:beta-alanine--pyruvate transaminase
MGGVVVSRKIYEAFENEKNADHQIGLFHGNTYSGHPLACAAGIATLDIYRDEGLFERAAKLESVLEDAVHSLRGEPFVVDIRNVGLAAGIELEADPKAPGRRGFDAIKLAFSEQNMVMRVGGDNIALSPPLIASESDIVKIVDNVRGVLKSLT